jgi:hypothetical protein
MNIVSEVLKDFKIYVKSQYDVGQVTCITEASRGRISNLLGCSMLELDIVITKLKVSKEIMEQMPVIKSVSYTISDTNSNLIVSDKIHMLAGETWIEDKFGDSKNKIEKTIKKVNNKIDAEMDKVKELDDLVEDLRVEIDDLKQSNLPLLDSLRQKYSSVRVRRILNIFYELQSTPLF